MLILQYKVQYSLNSTKDIEIFMLMFVVED